MGCSMSRCGLQERGRRQQQLWLAEGGLAGVAKVV